MKLYTEEQVGRIAKLYRHEMYLLEAAINTEKPIELPSDEEIENKSKLWGYGWEIYYKGAKWMRDLIQGGNK
jgi:hypothetical protein